MVTFSAPAKIYIFGEHAVIYGGSALACAIDLRTFVTVVRSETTTITSDIGRTGLNFDIHPYVSSAIKKICNEKVSVNIKSQIPIGSGLGSSAAATIATLAALNQELELGYKKDELANIGFEVEKDIQGVASPTDTYISTFGGMFEMPIKKRFNILDCDIVIGNTNIAKSTKQIINNVRIYKDEFSDIINPIIRTIGSITKNGEFFIRKKDYIHIGKLMNVNHGLLDAIGVNNQMLSSLVYTARESGAFGAKITGAGGGGCMIAIVKPDLSTNVAKAIEKIGGDAIITKASEKGLIQGGDYAFNTKDRWKRNNG